MIPQKNTVKVESFGGSESRAMSIDASSINHLMTVLGNLYSDSILAIIREYSTNAMDSHIAAGFPDRPITVTLPNKTHPIFTVTDEGTGLTEEEVYGIYGSYGASTKRESNAFNGQIGVGCKSAFSYTDQFTVTTTKDGQRKAFVFSLDENGVGEITKMGSEVTDRPNGLSVSIPVKSSDIYSFSLTAKRFYSAWEIKPIGVETFIPEGEVTVTDSLGHKVAFVPESFGYNDSSGIRIVMGNVPYPVPKKTYDELSSYVRRNHCNMTIYVPMGKVQFTPSREELKVTPDLVNILRQAHYASVAHIRKEITDEYSKAKTYMEALTLYKGLRRRFSNFFSVNRDAVPPFEGLDVTSNVFGETKLPGIVHSGRGFKLLNDFVVYDTDSVYLVVPGVTYYKNDAGYANISGLKRLQMAAVRAYSKAEGVRVYFVPDTSKIPKDNKKIGIPVKTLADLDEYVPVKSTVKREKPSGVYTYSGPGRGVSYSMHKVEAADLPPTGSTIVVVEMTGNRPTNLSRVSDDYLQDVLNKYKRDTRNEVYAIRSGNIEKIKKSYNVVFLEDELVTFLEAFIRANPNSAKATYSIPVKDLSLMNKIYEHFGDRIISDLEDPMITQVILDTAKVQDMYKKITSANRLYSEIGVLSGIKGAEYAQNLINTLYLEPLEISNIRTIFERYPLLIALSRSDAKVKDVTEYINSVHAKNFKENK